MTRQQETKRVLASVKLNSVVMNAENFEAAKGVTSGSHQHRYSSFRLLWKGARILATFQGCNQLAKDGRKASPLELHVWHIGTIDETGPIFRLFEQTYPSIAWGFVLSQREYVASSRISVMGMSWLAPSLMSHRQEVQYFYFQPVLQPDALRTNW